MEDRGWKIEDGNGVKMEHKFQPRSSIFQPRSGERIRQDGSCNGGADQSVGLKDLNEGNAEALIFGIEQSVIRTAEAIGL